MAKSVHDFTVETADGGEKKMSDYAGKNLLVVNVASKCGLTPQYEGLEALYNRYQDSGLEIIGFPCNQFKGQEPGTNAEIQEFCRVNYGVTFPVMAKIDVNGENTHPLYTYLKGEGGEDIAWNFTKFLVNGDGQVTKRFEPTETPEDMAPEIEQALN